MASGGIPAIVQKLQTELSYVQSDEDLAAFGETLVLTLMEFGAIEGPEDLIPKTTTTHVMRVATKTLSIQLWNQVRNVKTAQDVFSFTKDTLKAFQKHGIRLPS